MEASVRFHDFQQTDSARHPLHVELLEGLRRTPKQISPKFFYDQRGSELFEHICEQPEYYPTRTEEAILRDCASEVARLAGEDALLVELGSGASRKVRLLLEELRPLSYLGIDISRDFLLSSTRRLAADYPWLDVHAACADFSRALVMPAELKGRRPVAFFPGSSIGNFAPREAQAFLRNLHGLLPPRGGLLIGVDLRKDVAILDAAYNDAAGMTAAFNLNLLERLNREFEADFDPGRFTHRAFYDSEQGRVEMHLVSRQAQSVWVAGERFHFAAGETLHTENSYKYDLGGFRRLASDAGFSARAAWTDPQALFSIHYLERR